MSDNYSDGYDYFGSCDKDGEEWLIKQWAEWPTRVDQRFTTNIAFLHGAYIAYEQHYRRTPKTSKDLRSHFDLRWKMMK